MSTITYPDGSQLTSTALTDAQIQTTFQVITAQMLGILTSPMNLHVTLVIGQFVLTVDSTVNLYQGLVISATGLKAGTVISGVDTVNNTITVTNTPTVNGVVAASVTDPNAYYKVRIGWQIEGQPGPPISEDTVTITCYPIDTDYGRMRDVIGTVSGNTIINTDVYTRAWRTHWTFYGPNALDNARAVRSALITIQFVTDYLSNVNLYVNPSIEEPKRVPENFQGRWWERLDLDVEFNEQVTETFTVGTVGSVEVKVYTKDGQISDFTVTIP